MITWLWVGNSILNRDPKLRYRYAFNCKAKLVRLLETDFGRSGDDDWVIPDTNTRADRWRKEICSKSQFFR